VVTPNHHRLTCMRAATNTPLTFVVGLMVFLPGCGSPSQPVPTGQPPFAVPTHAAALPGAQPISTTTAGHQERHPPRGPSSSRAKWSSGAASWGGRRHDTAAPRLNVGFGARWSVLTSEPA